MLDRPGRSLPGPPPASGAALHARRSEEHTCELQSQSNLVCRLLLEKKKKTVLENYIVPLRTCARHMAHTRPYAFEIYVVVFVRLLLSMSFLFGAAANDSVVWYSPSG